MKTKDYEDEKLFKEYVNVVECKLVSRSINFATWKGYYDTYQKFNKEKNLNREILSRFGLCLYNAFVLTTNRDEKLILNNFQNELFKSFYKNGNKEDLYIYMIVSRIRVLRKFFDSCRSINYFEWLGLYEDFRTTYFKLVELDSDMAKLVIKEYADVLLKARLVEENYDFITSFNNKLDTLKLTYSNIK